MGKSDDWQPTLGDVLRAKPEGAAAARFREVGFDLHLTIQEQSSASRGDKNDEGQHPPNLRRTTMPDRAVHEHETTATPNKRMLEAADEMRQAGMTVGFPVVVQVDDKLLAAIKRGQEPIPLGQDLGRFAAKASIGAVIGLITAVGYYYITKPPAMDMA